MTTEDQPTTVSTAAVPPAEAKNTDTEPQAVPYERFKQVNDTLKELQAWKAKQEQAAAKQAEAQAQAQEQQLAEQQKWQELAEKRQAERDALSAERETLAGKFEAYSAAVQSILTTQKKDLPKHIIALLDKLDPVEQLQYIAENADELTPKAAAPGTPQAPKRQSSTQPTQNGQVLRL